MRLLIFRRFMKVLCDLLQPKVKILITDKNGVRKRATIRRMIIMQRYSQDVGSWCIVEDVEILLNKKRNIYFSYMAYLRGESWVKDIVITEK